MLPPFAWLGGKVRMAKRLLPLLPAHHTYVEPFAGSAALLFAKPPSPVEVINDRDEGIVNFFRVLRDPDSFRRFKRLVTLTPYARTEYLRARATWVECADAVERAWAWFIVARMSFGGCFGSSFGTCISTSSRGMAAEVSSYLGAIERLPEVAARVLRVQVENQDWRVILKRYDTPETFFYLDPPYLPETRRDGGYRYELSAGDHEEMVERLLALQGKAILSGYDAPLYDRLTAAGWQKRAYHLTCNVAGRTRASGLLGPGAVKARQSRTEMVWANFPLPVK